MNKLDDSDLLTPLEPSSIKNDTTVKRLTSAINPHLLAFYAHLHDALFLYRLDSLSSDTLDHLARQWRVPVWRDSWEITTKRTVLRSTISSLSRMGTRKAINDCLASLGASAVLKEWWEGAEQATAHTFSINLDINANGKAVSREQISDLTRLLNASKPVRSQYTLVSSLELNQNIKLYPGERSIVWARITCPQKKSDTVRISVAVYPASRNLAFSRTQLWPTIHDSVEVPVTFNSALGSMSTTRINNKEA